MYQDISNICLIFNAQTLQNQSTDLPKSQLLMLNLVVFFVVIPAFVFFLGHFILTSRYSGSLSCLYLLMPTVGTNFWSNLVFAPIPPMLMPRITFAHGTSPFTSDQLKLGRAGEPKGWNGHGGLKVLCLL